LKLHPGIIRVGAKKSTPLNFDTVESRSVIVSIKNKTKQKKKKRYTGGFEWTVKFALTLFTRAPSNALIVAAAIK